VRVNAPPDPGASLRRITMRAALMLIPAVAVVVAAPWALRRLRPAARPPSAEVLARLEGGALAPPGEDAAERPRLPERPTDEQIEKARATQVALGKAQKGWESVTVITPRSARAGDDGLESMPFHGFGVSVDSAPEGATVLVDGEEMGETPLVASVKCTPGADVQVRVEKPPRPAQEKVVRCRADTLVKLRFTF
jgi:hypothetical protein